MLSVSGTVLSDVKILKGQFISIVLMWSHSI